MCNKGLVMITTAPLDPFSKCHLQNIWWGFALFTPSVLPSSLFNIDYALFVSTCC